MYTTSFLPIKLAQLTIHASDPNLCGVGSDVLCWIEPTAQGDSPSDGMIPSSYQANSLDNEGLDNGLGAPGYGDQSSSNTDMNWLASDNSQPLEGDLSNIDAQSLLGTMPNFETHDSESLDTGSSDYSLFSRWLN